MWLRRHFVAFVIVFAALVTIADGNLTPKETSRIEEPCGITLIGASLPRRVVAWERTQGAVVEATQGFTLVEIAIVLMVIGLLVGGILWGVEMIGQAATRAQISQVEKFNTAANSFYVKYGYLPGDIPDPYASQFGFQARGTNPGQGDGNGIVEGYQVSIGANALTQGGEESMFWVDLSAANMLDGNFNTATPTSSSMPGPSSASLWLPAAKIGQSNFVMVWGGDGWASTAFQSHNYFAVEAFNTTTGSPTTGMTVQQAYAIDSKIDDGLPQSGYVTAGYDAGGTCAWSGQNVGNCLGAEFFPGFIGTPTTCMDNRGVTSGTMYYSTSQSGGGLNCALSFQVQWAGR